MTSRMSTFLCTHVNVISFKYELLSVLFIITYFLNVMKAETVMVKCKNET